MSIMIFIYLWCFVSGNFSNKVICTFFMPVMTRNMVDLQDEILTKIEENFNYFKIAIIAEIREHVKQEVSEPLEKEVKKKKELLFLCVRNMWKFIRNKWISWRQAFCSVVVAERRRFFLTSSLPLIEILQNHFFRLHNCNNHATLKFHRDSQVDLHMNKASNFAEERRNRENHTKPCYRILEAARIQVSSDTDVNVLLSRKNYLRFWITYPTGRFCKENWIWNHKYQAALMKSSKRRIRYFARRLHCCRFPQIPQHVV